MSRALIPGDVIEGSLGQHYVVVGFSPHGKTRLVRLPQRTETSGWWPAEHTLPDRWRVIVRAGEGLTPTEKAA